MSQSLLATITGCLLVLLLFSPIATIHADDEKSAIEPAPVVEPKVAEPAPAAEPTKDKPAKEAKLSAEQFQKQFWKYLQEGPAAYDEWTPLPGKKAELTVGKSPHGSLIRTWANRAARSNPAKMADGAILIKENFNDERTLVAVTVMYRTTGYDPEANDWFWIKYLPDGSVAKNSDGQAIAGKVKSCKECHAGAKGDDFVFSNDPTTD